MSSQVNKSVVFNIDVSMQDGKRQFKIACKPGEERYLLIKLQDKLKQDKSLLNYKSVRVYKQGSNKPCYTLSPKFLTAPLTISVIGTGYVGLITGVGLCHRGRRVICMDIDKEKVARINRREAPIYEEGLQEMLISLPEEYFSCTTDLKHAIMNSDATFIAVGTPPKESGEQDLSYIKQAARDIGNVLKHKKGHLVVVKSTVVPGTTQKVIKKLIAESAGHSDFRIAMVPEFLREGLALQDFLNPFRIVVGVECDEDFDAIKFIYKEFKTIFFKTTIPTAEMIKYTSNAILATKISFANEIGNLCKGLGVDVYEVMDAVGLDKRISRKHLNAGRGFGGSCLPKDVKALIHLGKRIKVPTPLLSAVWEVNETQPLRLVELAEKRVGLLKGKSVAVLGLAFKPGTDDIRESPAIIVIRELLRRGAEVLAYDPIAIDNMARVFPKIKYFKDPKEAIAQADVVIGVTEWPELKNEELYKDKVLIDGMKFLEKKTGKNYEGICW